MARHVADIVIMKYVHVFVGAAHQDIVDGNGDGDGGSERLYRCHPHCRLRRESSLSTLTGEELEAFAETLPVDGHSVHDSSVGTETFCDSDDGYTM